MEQHKDPDSYETEIARAIIVLSASMDNIAYQLSRLGIGDASTPYGAIEALGMTVEKGLERLSDSVAKFAQE